MLQTRHIVAATLAHVAFFVFILVASEYSPSRPMPQPTVIEAVMLDETPEERAAHQERLEEERRQQEREEQRQREEEQRRQQEEEARQRAEAEAQARREREEQRRRAQEEEQRQREAEAEKRRQEAEAQRRREEEAERQRQEEERQRQEEERRRQEEERRRQEEEQRRKEEERRRQEEERRQREEEERRRALQEQIEREERELRQRAAVESWQPRMSRHIERFWRRPPELGTARDMSVRLRVRILPDGTVTGVQVLESSGNISFDRSAERAVQAASPLPQPDGGFFFREFTTVFQPE